MGLCTVPVKFVYKVVNDDYRRHPSHIIQSLHFYPVMGVLSNCFLSDTNMPSDWVKLVLPRRTLNAYAYFLASNAITKEEVPPAAQA